MQQTVLIHGKIKTMAGLTLENGYIRIRDGKVHNLGEMECFQTEIGEECIDLKGALVLPGFIDAHCHIGICEDGLGFEGDDTNEDTDPSTPHLRAIDAVNPMDKSFAEALDYGITTVVTGPGSANPISGQFCAVKTYGRRIDDMVVKAPVAMKMALGENPKVSYHDKEQAPITRMATAAIIREQLRKAQRYLSDIEKAKEDEDTDEPEFDAKCEALIPLLTGKIKAHIHAHRADDIFTAMRLAKEFKIGYVIIHCTEGHLIADILGQQGVSAICGPIIGTRTKPELCNSTTACPGILAQNGVRVAISTDHPELPEHFLAVSAAVAVRDGMDAETALESITSAAAEICEIQHRVGSIRVGLDADLVVFRGDPLAIASKPEMVFVEGIKVR